MITHYDNIHKVDPALFHYRENPAPALRLLGHHESTSQCTPSSASSDGDGFMDMREDIYDYIDRHGPTCCKDIGLALGLDTASDVDALGWYTFYRAVQRWADDGVIILKDGLLRFDF